MAVLAPKPARRPFFIGECLFVCSDRGQPNEPGRSGLRRGRKVLGARRFDISGLSRERSIEQGAKPTSGQLHQSREQWQWPRAWRTKEMRFVVRMTRGVTAL